MNVLDRNTIQNLPNKSSKFAQENHEISKCGLNPNKPIGLLNHSNFQDFKPTSKSSDNSTFTSNPKLNSLKSNNPSLCNFNNSLSDQPTNKEELELDEKEKELNEIWECMIEDVNISGVRFRASTLTSIVTEDGREHFNHWSAHYCTGKEDIQGIIVVRGGVLTFTATKTLPTTKERKSILRRSSKEVCEKEFGNLEAVISIQDIAACNIMTFPVPCGKHCNKVERVHILQLALYDHGQYSLEQELNDVIGEIKNKKKPYVCVYFNIKPENEGCCATPESQSALLRLQVKIQSVMKSKKISRRPVQISNLPYFEFLAENFPQNQGHLLRIAKQAINIHIQEQVKILRENATQVKLDLKYNKFYSQGTTKASDTNKSNSVSPFKTQKRIVVPTMIDQSTIVTDEQFGQIIACVPDLYQMLDWRLMYSSWKHGSSYINLMRRAKFANPFLIIVRDTNNNIFGAYGSDTLKFSQNYYGSGETFIFTFKQTNEIQEFPWSKKNNLYIFVNEDGIMFGAKPFYGLWIDSELSRGRTHVCETFNNTLLSDAKDFEIAKVEVWSVIDPFTKK